MDKILSYLETNENLTPYVTDLLEDQNMLQLLIDCTKFDFIPLKERSYLETLSRGGEVIICFQGKEIFFLTEKRGMQPCHS